MKQLILLSEDDIPRLTAISGNIDVDNLTPYIKMAQDTQLKRILTAPLYDKILNDYSKNNLRGVYLNIYNDFVVDLLVYYSAMNVVLFNSFEVSNGGVYQKEPVNADPLGMEDVEKIATRYRQLGASVELEFNKWIRHNKVKEYKNSGCGDNTNYQLSWYF